MLGRLAVARPDDRAAAVADAVRDPQPLVVRNVRQRRGERRRHTLEGVVVVVQYDDVPRRAEAGPGAAVDPLLRRRFHGPIVVTSPTVSTVTFDVEAVRARFSALR